MAKPKTTFTPEFDEIAALKAFYNAQIIEPRIRPLVNALNDTKLVNTWSSCQGHFYSARPTAQWAHVHFESDISAPKKVVDYFLRYLAAHVDKHTGTQISITGTYAPWDHHTRYSISILPLCSTNASPRLKRKLTDKGIRHAIRTVRNAMKPEEKAGFLKEMAQHINPRYEIDSCYNSELKDYLDRQRKSHQKQSRQPK